MDESPCFLEEIPEIARAAINAFNMLGDRIAVDIGYLGKDYTNLPLYMEIWEIEDKEFFLEIINWFRLKSYQKIRRNNEAGKR